MEHLFLMSRATGLAVTGDFTGIEAWDGKQVLGIVGYDKWTHNAVRIHVFVPKGAIPPRELIQEAFDYPFKSKRILLAEIAKSNERSLKMAKHFGFKKIYSIKDGWDVGDDIVVLELRREAWQARRAA
jgi:RimJ/RimL family protein N-acetyltransferase